MTQPETPMGGTGAQFPSTAWSAIIEAADPTSPACRERLEHLCRLYWKPVYAYVRTAWRKSVDDSQDLTQAFFTRLVQKDFLSHVRPERGSFRGYLKRALRNFLIDAERMESVRRPHGTLFSLDALPEEMADLTPTENESPDAAYDRTWFRCLFESAVDELRKTLERDGQSTSFKVFQLYCLEPQTTREAPLAKDADPTQTYRDVAQRLSLTEDAVGTCLGNCRSALRRILSSRIRDYAIDEAEAERELQQALQRRM